MLKEILDLIIPHYCLNCSEKGIILCPNCKNYIINQSKNGLQVKLELAGFDKCYCFGDKNNQLKSIIYQYKLASIRDLAPILTEFYLAMIPKDSQRIIVPLPTAKAHIKQRSFDHIELIANYISQKTNWPIMTGLVNHSKKPQKDLSAKERKQNVSNAFETKQQLNPGAKYLLIDDFVTTGASAKACLSALKQAGAKQVELAILIKN